MEFKKTELKAAEFGGAEKAIRYAVIGAGKCLQLSLKEKAANKAAEFFAETAVEAVRRGFDIAPDGGTLLTRRAWREAQLVLNPAHWCRSNKGNVVALKPGREKAANKAALQAQCLSLAAKDGKVDVNLCNRIAAANKTELVEILAELTKKTKKTN